MKCTGQHTGAVQRCKDVDLIRASCVPSLNDHYFGCGSNLGYPTSCQSERARERNRLSLS